MFNLFVSPHQPTNHECGTSSPSAQHPKLGSSSSSCSDMEDDVFLDALRCVTSDMHIPSDSLLAENRVECWPVHSLARLYQFWES